jgi:RsmE family RNA methyltransferase
VGDQIKVCDSGGVDYTCVIQDIQKNIVSCKIINAIKNDAEPSIKVSLFIALPNQIKWIL